MCVMICAKVAIFLIFAGKMSKNNVVVQVFSGDSGRNRCKKRRVIEFLTRRLEACEIVIWRRENGEGKREWDGIEEEKGE